MRTTEQPSRVDYDYLMACRTHAMECGLDVDDIPIPELEPAIRQAECRIKAGPVYFEPIGPKEPPADPNIGGICTYPTSNTLKPVPKPKRPNASQIIRQVCAMFAVHRRDVLSERRTKDIVLPRQIIMWRLRYETPMSLPKIGQIVGNRDHTTVMHAVKKIDALLEDIRKHGDGLPVWAKRALEAAE